VLSRDSMTTPEQPQVAVAESLLMDASWKIARTE
jgi:hypothetical protein